MSNDRLQGAFDGGVEGHALLREGTQKPFPPDDHEGAGLCEASVESGTSDDFKRGLDFAANWHEAEASHAKAVRSEMDRYSDDHEERAGWRSWKDKEDRHLYCAAVIRKLPRPSDTPPAPQAVEAVSVDEVERVIVAWADAEELELTIRQVHALARALLAKFKMEGR